MRYLLFIILVLLLAYAWWPRHEPPPVEETFIGDQIKPLRKAEKFQQQDYNEALDDYREKLDAAEESEGE
jgi:hypothetical protein